MAMDLLRQAGELYSRGGAGRDAAATLNRLGTLYSQGGEPDSAMAYYRPALSMARAVADQTGEAETLNGVGGVFLDIGQPDSALAYLHQALRVGRAAGARITEARTLNRIGAVFAGIGEPDSALAYYGEALSIRRAIGDRTGEAGTLNNIGIVFAGIGQRDSALAYLLQSLPILHAVGDRIHEAQALANIGVYFKGIGRPDSALAYYRQALPILHAAGERTVEARTLGNIGVVFRNTGQPDSALAYYRQALPIQRDVRDRGGEASTLNNIGSLFSGLGAPDSALAYYRQALPILHAVGDRAMEALTLGNIGGVFSDLGAADSALAYYRQALPMKQAAGDREGEALTLDHIGIVFADNGQPDSALVYYREALAIRRDIDDRTGEAQTLNNIGGVLAGIDQPDSALVYYRRALPMLRAVGDRAGEVTTLGNIGGVYSDIGRSDSAVVYFDRSTALSATISKRTGSDFSQLRYNETTARTFSLWTLAWLALASPGQAGSAITPGLDGTSAAYGALAASERGRAQALLDLMGDSLAEVIPETDFPAHGRRLAGSVTGTGSAALVYLATRDTLLIWVVGPDSAMEVVRIPIPYDSLAARIGAVRQTLGAADQAILASRGKRLESPRVEHPVLEGGRRGPWASAALELAALLLPPRVLELLSGAREVVLVPHSALALVPFAVLPAGPSGTPFGSTVAVRYAPSLATLNQAESRPGLPSGGRRAVALRTALVVGNPSMPEIAFATGERDALAPLPGAEAESRGVAVALGARPLTRGAATESLVRRRLPDAPVVHLATHGFAYSTEANARNSFVALAPDSGNDGRLTVGEILDDPALKLNADLVVLSACQTGLGDLKQAEGTVGLQRAFLAKGARSVLVSLWNVSDAATRKLMTGFYRHWLSDQDHPDKAESLRRAQEEVRKTPGWEHPRFWAGFQLVGAR